MAVLYNQGPPLVEQRDTINQKFKDFKKLYPLYTPDWSKIQLSVEQPISWDQYLQHEAQLMQRFCDKTKSIKDRLLECIDYLAEEMAKTPRGASAAAAGKSPAPAETDKAESSSASVALNKLDKHLLTAFHKLYFPRRAYRRSSTCQSSGWVSGSTPARCLKLFARHAGIREMFRAS